MLAWIGYALSVGLLLSLAALLGERAARLRRGATRWVWAAALAASVALPAAMASLSVPVPAMLRPTLHGDTLALRDLTSQRLSPTAWAVRKAGPAVTAPRLDPPLRNAWMAISGTLLLGVAASTVALYRRKRHWPAATVDGTSVRVAPDAGPAVVGLLRPRIVVPRWLLAAPPAQQALVMAHERAHLAARDPQLLSLALLLLVAIPWNLPAWWLLRRLRRAIEVDCDARVLAAGHSLKAYGAALIDVGQRQSRMAGTVTAMTESASFLEQRIGIMVQAPRRWGRAAALACACAALCLAAVAVRVGPPDAVRPSILLAPSVLDRYVGYYQVNEAEVMVVSRDGQRLWTKLALQRPAEIVAESERTFRVLPFAARIDFSASALVIRQNGAVITAPRIESEQVQRIDEAIADKASRQQASAGGRAALVENIANLLAGRPLSAALAPEFAQMIARDLARARAQLAAYGPVRAVRFEGISREGWDNYRIDHEHGALEWHLLVGTDGKIIKGFFNPAQGAPR